MCGAGTWHLGGREGQELVFDCEDQGSRAVDRVGHAQHTRNREHEGAIRRDWWTSGWVLWRSGVRLEI